MIDGASSCAQSFIRRAGMRSGPSDFLLSVCFRRHLTSGTETYLKWKRLAVFIGRTLTFQSKRICFQIIYGIMKK